VLYYIIYTLFMVGRISSPTCAYRRLDAAPVVWECLEARQIKFAIVADRPEAGR
jgi:hypothetical protein